ncbi:MAG: hypothetical protein AAF705_17605, partial [Bacteroidota bacterium]
HIDKFENLVRQHNAEIPVQHFVNKALLDIALANGQTDAQLFLNQLEKIKAHQPDLMVCTCSTLGAECDKDPNMHRIDQPIAAYIVQHYDRIGLAYTAHSTQTISENLLLQTSKDIGRPIEIVPIDCSAYWLFFEQENMQAYEEGIANTILEQSSEVDVVFLAQASMAGAQSYLQGLDKEVLTSPEYGIKTLLEKLI